MILMSLDIVSICVSRIGCRQTHHLPESFYIGDPAESKKTLDYIEELLGRLAPCEKKESIRQEAVYFRNLVGYWEEYLDQQWQGTFPEWCAEAGRDIRSSYVYYY